MGLPVTGRSRVNPLLTFQRLEAVYPGYGSFLLMNIGEVSRASGLPAKTIRYYEDIGLVRPARGANDYRDFSEQDAHKLAFIGRSRSLGFSIEECRTLLSLYEDRDRASADVKAVAAEHLERIAQKIDELQALKSTLETLVTRCHGDDRPDCPILDDLAGSEALNA